MSTLLNIIESLEDPDVRLEDNSKYKLDLTSLGMLYAHAVSSAGMQRSPGRVLSKDSTITPGYEQILQKKFQHHTRGVLRDNLARLRLRDITADDLTSEIHSDEYNPSLFSEDSVEYHVTQLAADGQFIEIGATLRKAAEKSNQNARKVGKITNYPLSKEYCDIKYQFLHS